MSELYELRCDALASDLRVLSFRGREAINEPYQFCIGAVTREGDGVDMDDVVGEKATLALNAPGHDAPQLFHGVIAAVEHLHQMDDRAVFEITLVPRLWTLTQTHHCRVFVDETAPNIIAQILAHNGIEDVRLALRESYPTMPFVCQYRESDLAFITRWMEREGMHYFFEQGETGETLVIADHPSGHTALANKPVRFVPASTGDTGVGEALTYFRGRSRMLPANVTVRDYDYDNPKLDVRGAADVSKRGRGEIHLHGQNFSSPSEGQRLAKIRAEELKSRQKMFQGHGRAFQLRPGYTFTLDEHPRIKFNTDYLVTELEHHGNQAVSSDVLRALLGVEHDDEYRVQVSAVPASIHFRPERLTPWPRIYGTENGVVDGPATSAYAQVNDSGCYKVKIDFDESTLSGGGASCWVRMLQPHGGEKEGFHFPLRAGTEVLLTFLGGDPDQPVISGVLPNALKASPVAAANYTKNVLQTGGLNRLEMEDLDGKQHVRMNTPTENTVLHMGAPLEGYNVDIRTDGDAQWNARRNYDERVGGDNTKHVEGEVARTYDKSEETHIKENRFTRIDGSYDKTIGGPQATTVDGDVGKSYKSDYSKTVDGSSHRRVGTATYYEDIQPNGNVVEFTTGLWNTGIEGERTLAVNGAYTADLAKEGGDTKVHAYGNYELIVDKNYRQHVTGDVQTLVEGQWETKYYAKKADYNFAQTAEVTGGVATSTFLGLKNFNVFGVNVSTLLGGAISMNLAGLIDCTTSAKVTCSAGIHLDMTPSGVRKIENTTDQGVINVANKEIKMEVVRTQGESIKILKVVK